jgi:hypothetical protein
MDRNTFMRKTWKVWALCLAVGSIATMQAGRDTTVTASQTNGTWATPAGEFKIWALDDHRLRVEFSVAAEHKGEPGPMGNTGNGHGITTVQGNTALFKPEGAAADCRITLKFKRRSLVVTQTSTCDFGKYANVDGTSKRVSTSKPVFLSRCSFLAFPNHFRLSAS